MEVDAVEIGHVAIFGLHEGAEVVHRIAGDAGAQPFRHRSRRHAANHLLVDQLIILAQQRAQPRDDLRRALDKAKLGLETLQQIAPGLRIDADIVRVGVELGPRQEQAVVEAAVGADLGQQPAGRQRIHDPGKDVPAVFDEVVQHDGLDGGRFEGQGHGQDSRQGFTDLVGPMLRRAG